MTEIKSRTSYHGQLKKIQDAASKHNTTSLTLEQVDSYLERIHDVMEKIENLHFKVLGTCQDDTAYAVQEQAMNDIVDTFFAAKTELRKIKKQLQQQDSSSSGPSSFHSQPALKLPRIDLPSFWGQYEDWPSFEDLFSATIHKNGTLSDSQKLQYLKTCLQGDAGKLIKSFTITDANYSEAWKLLSERYSNKREIVHSLIKKIVFQQSIKAESATNLQTLFNNTMESVRSLKVLGRPTDTWDDILSVIIIEKLDPETKAEWAKSLQGTEPPTFKNVLDFLERHIRSLIARGPVSSKATANNNGNNNHHKPQQHNHARIHHASTSNSAITCSMCKGNHPLYKCSKLLALPAEQRIPAVKKTSACLNCLREGHTPDHCLSSRRCKHCNENHNSLLHAAGNSKAQQSDGSGTSQKKTIGVVSASADQSQVLLKTAIVNIEDSSGIKRPCRAFLDGGAEASLITEKCAKALGLQLSKADVIIEGVGSTKVFHTKWRTTARLESNVYEAHVDVDLLLVPQVTGRMPRVSCESTTWDHLKDIQLADPTFNQPSDIDILLGEDVVASIMRDGRKEGRRHTPIAQNSIFGWVLSGKINVQQQSIVKINHVSCHLEQLVERFWKVQDVPERTLLTAEEEACEQHFKTTHSRTGDGKYVVRLPFNHKKASIGDTRQLAENRLLQLEKRFKKYPHHHEAYKEFMRDYFEMGHMERVEESANTSNSPVYIPHHFVTKEDSSTTKLRVVFDASMKPHNGVSLNDALMVGPTIQDDLFSLLLQFRTHPVALKADVAKMYRQFLVHEDDRDYQRILWRENPEDPIQAYRLNTVTYGTACAPYLATRCLQQLADDEGEKFPRAAAVIKKNMYVDDLLGGETTTQEAITLAAELNDMCALAKLEMRKWSSSKTRVIESIPESLRETSTSLEFETDMSLKALGVRWQPAGDFFHFSTKTMAKPNWSKRDILSEVAKTFDPLGWLAPVTITAKILLQDLWKETIGWDDAVPTQHKERWQTYQQQLEDISKIQIPRCIIPQQAVNYQIHGFSDASEKAYAAAVYLRCTTADGKVQVTLLTAKSKVSPIKHTSLPRLELCGAHLLAETIEAVVKVFSFKYTLYAWTDSTIVLKWITSPSRRWKTYVANRVAAIQDSVPARHWGHVASKENPADLPSRGVLPQDLVDNRLWWHGPTWLASAQFPISSDTVDMSEVGKEEKTKEVTIATATLQNENPVLQALLKLSSLVNIVISVAWVTRFITFLRFKQTKSKFLSVMERRNALHTVIRLVQNSAFNDDIQQLRKTSPSQVKPSSKLKKLTPFLDNKQLLRVGGRLQNAAISTGERHPIILPKLHPLTSIIIHDCHQSTLHGGYNLVLSTLRRKYWIISGRDVVRFALRRCVPCRKANAETSQQLMGNLPTGRVTPNRPFLHVGVDFAGPFRTRPRRGRGVRSEKCYLAIFVCFSTKAVHLEPVKNLSTGAFIACYTKFVSRRGVSSHVYSDCGTNFVGADRELRRMFEEYHDEIQQKMTAKGTTWVFNPPAAPHQGGLWEAAVKSAKYHLKRVMGTAIPTMDEFETLLCSVESCLNSRPLCPLSSDPLDTDALTPAHFLIGEPLTSIPEPDLTLVKTTRLDHWQQARQLQQLFWRRWKDEYLVSLQQRVKWTRKHNNILVGDLVVIKDESIAPTRWRLGRIIATHPGQDGLVRKATIRTASGNVTRPIHKLSVILQCDES